MLEEHLLVFKILYITMVYQILMPNLAYINMTVNMLLKLHKSILILLELTNSFN